MLSFVLCSIDDDVLIFPTFPLASARVCHDSFSTLELLKAFEASESFHFNSIFDSAAHFSLFQFKVFCLAT